MKFQKGHKKIPGSGRRKGQTCKLAAEVRTKLEELGCDPIVGMATIAMDPDTTPELRGRMNAELAKYVYPQRKAMELSGPDGAAIETHDSALESLAARIDGIAVTLGAGEVAERPN